MTENIIAREVVDVAYQIHTTLGPGLLESVYETILANQLQKRELRVVRQQAIPLIYDGIVFPIGFRADLVVEEKVIVEIKSIADLTPLHKKQLLTYLRLADLRLGPVDQFQHGENQGRHYENRQRFGRIKGFLGGFAPWRDICFSVLTLVSCPKLNAH